MVRRLVPVPLFSLVMLGTTGCAQLHYNGLDRGELSGRLVVEWVGPDQFRFTPHPQDPLTFVRDNGDRITPGVMYTDGGSIPRPLWALKSYSPWGYAPAFIIHDWLFEMEHCQLPGHEDYDVQEAAVVMGEVLKTMREDRPLDGPSKLVIYTMQEAVSTRIAAHYWTNGECDQADGAFFIESSQRIAYEVSWPPPPSPAP